MRLTLQQEDRLGGWPQVYKNKIGQDVADSSRKTQFNHACISE